VRWTVFLDRDGVLNRKAPDGDYVKSWDEFAWLPGAREAVHLLNIAGALAVVVTNQRGVARGLMRADDVISIHRRMQDELRQLGARLDGIYFCPHETGQCRCRKPEIGLFLQARSDFPEIDFSRSFMVGDSLADMEAAYRIGARPVWVGGTDQAASFGGSVLVANNLLDAVTNIILPVVRESGSK
jgi:D-glycero-D-manno-heptose 1,7-bisphosphate phosphatase